MIGSFAFRKAKSSGPVLSRQESMRQGSAVRSAAAALGDPDAVRNFLNTFHAGLSGRPLDLAVASDAGLEAVESALGAEAVRAGSAESGA